MATDKKLKYTLLSALLIGALVACLAMVAVSLQLDAPAAPQVAEAPKRPVPTRVALNLSSAFAKKRSLERAAVQVAEAAAPDVYPEITPASYEPAVQTAAINPALKKVAIIIDDLGHNPRHSAGALSLPQPVAFALLPYTRFSKTLARQAEATGHELIVHIPMQPKNSGTNPGPNVLKAGLDEAELRRLIAWNLDQFEGYTAVNNHMGSRFTEDRVAMRILFEELAARGLAFYDSRTTAASSSVELAAGMGVPLAERDVFLDNEQEALAVDRQLQTLEQLARRNGNAIAIGHPHQVTFEQITAWAETLPAKGLVLVSPSEIMRDRRTPYWRRMIRTAQNTAEGGYQAR